MDEDSITEESSSGLQCNMKSCTSLDTQPNKRIKISCDDWELKTADFSSKGMFGPGGLLAALEANNFKNLNSNPSSTENQNCINSIDEEADIAKRMEGKDEPSFCTVEKIKLPVDVGVSSDQQQCNSDLKNLHSLPPQETAFFIDNIIEFIFSFLNRKTLLTSRSVSHRWAYFGSKELQKMITMKFTNLPYNSSQYSYRSLQDLTTTTKTLLKNFPCNSFAFYSSKTIHPYDQPFFQIHGSHINKLELVEFISLDHFKKLILSHAPNIEELIIDAEVFLTKPKSKPNSPSHMGMPMVNMAMGVESICLFSDTNGSDNANHKFKLKYLEFSEKTVCPPNVIYEILEHSPNLNQVKLSTKYLHLLVQPSAPGAGNRLHLLKTLTISVNSETLYLLEFLGYHHGGNWALEELNLFGGHKLFTLPHLWARAADAMSKVLGAISDSCEKLEWRQLGFLEGLQIPQMSKLKQIKLLYRHPSVFGPGIATQLFPMGMSLRDKFPNLKSIYIQNNLKFWDVPHSISDIFDNVEPVPSVRKVCLQGQFYLHKNLLKTSREMFPNATLSNKMFT